MAEFDPIRDVRFRGRELTDLTNAELLEALVFALKQVNALTPKPWDVGAYPWNAAPRQMTPDRQSN